MEIKLVVKKEKNKNTIFLNYKKSWANLLIECYEDFKKNNYEFTDIKHSKYFIVSKINNISIFNLLQKSIKKILLEKEIDIKDLENTLREFKELLQINNKMEKIKNINEDNVDDLYLMVIDDLNKMMDEYSTKQKLNKNKSDLRIVKYLTLVNEYIRFLTLVKKQQIILIDSSLIDLDDITQKIKNYKKLSKN